MVSNVLILSLCHRGRYGGLSEVQMCFSCLVAQPCSTLCDPMGCNPPGSSGHGILQARILEWVAISSSTCVLQALTNRLNFDVQEEGAPAAAPPRWGSWKAKASSGTSWEDRLLCPRLPCPPPGDRPDPGIDLTSLVFLALAGRFFTTSSRCLCKVDFSWRIMKFVSCQHQAQAEAVFAEMIIHTSQGTRHHHGSNSNGGQTKRETLL